MALCGATKGKERVDPSGKTRSPKIDRSPDPPAIHAWLRRQLILGLLLTSRETPEARRLRIPVLLPTCTAHRMVFQALELASVFARFRQDLRDDLQRKGRKKGALLRVPLW